MGSLNFNHHCLVIFLVFTGLRSLGSSPIPLLQDSLNKRSSALPLKEKGALSQRRHGLLDKQGIVISTLKPPSALDSLADSSKDPASFDDLKSLNTQRRSNFLKAAASKQSLMQLRVSRESSEGGVDLKSSPKQQNSNGLLSLSSAQQLWQLLPKAKEDTDAQSQENFPPNPAVHSEDSDHEVNSVLLPQTQPAQQSDLPLKNGLSLINLGRLDLKTDRCTAYHFKEDVRHHKCRPVSVDNNMCYGQCNSFYIPKRFVSCSYCAPSKLETINVRLECPGQNPDFVIKKVSIVKDCACKDCGLEHP